jgi:hypothetical protein
MIEKLSKQLVEICINECKKEDNKNTIKNHILDPLIMHILIQTRPFVVATIAYFILNMVMIIVLLVLLVVPNHK